jgi:hypothetical protein
LFASMEIILLQIISSRNFILSEMRRVGVKKTRRRSVNYDEDAFLRNPSRSPKLNFVICLVHIMY